MEDFTEKMPLINEFSRDFVDRIAERRRLRFTSVV